MRFAKLQFTANEKRRKEVKNKMVKIKKIRTKSLAKAVALKWLQSGKYIGYKLTKGKMGTL